MAKPYEQNLCSRLLEVLPSTAIPLERLLFVLHCCWKRESKGRERVCGCVGTLCACMFFCVCECVRVLVCMKADPVPVSAFAKLEVESLLIPAKDPQSGVSERSNKMQKYARKFGKHSKTKAWTKEEKNSSA